jgi:plastocyanin
MNLRRTPTAVAVAALVAAAVIVPVATSSAAKKKPKKVVKTIKVLDDFYAPSKLSIKKNTELKWVWSKQNYDSHNVTLSKGPKGIKTSKWTSATGTSGINFNRTFTKPGTYHFYCTVHPESMKLTVVVKG